MEDLQPFKNSKNLLQSVNFKFTLYFDIIKFFTLLSLIKAVFALKMNLYWKYSLDRRQTQIK